jgi:two-component system, NarL family, sensor histidine kinase UhpB
VALMAPGTNVMFTSSNRVSLLWRVFGANVAVFLVAFALLAWAPIRIDRVATPNELLILGIGLAVILAVDLVLVRRAFGPLRRLATVMSAVDPAQPGRRAEATSGSGREVVALTDALNGMLDRLEDERRESARRALAAQEGERERIARELHDEVGQTLTAIALRAERAVDEPSAQGRALSEIAQTLLRSLEDVQRIGRELRPEALDDLGLVSALSALCSRVAGQGGLRVRRDLDWRLPALSAESELVIYRVAQEALTNVLRHARCGEVTVSLRDETEWVALRVRDNGRGLSERRNGSGLGGMRERARLIGARLDVRSGEGAGTEIILTVPVAPA